MQTKNPLKEHWLKGVIFILSLWVVYLSSFAQIDLKANERLDSSFKQALGVFATVKALNGVISLAQGTEVGPPGVTISIGEILDPINDLVERFSWVMLASLTSLGIQKILMNVVVFKGFEVLLILSLLVVNILMFVKQKKYTSIKNIFFQFTILLVFLRFSIPFMAMSNEYIYTNFIQQNYSIEQSEKSIVSAKEDISKFDDKKASYFSTDYYKNKIKEFKLLTSDASNHIVELIIVFIFQTMLFPLLFLWGFYKIFISFLKSLKVP